MSVDIPESPNIDVLSYPYNRVKWLSSNTAIKDDDEADIKAYI